MYLLSLSTCILNLFDLLVLDFNSILQSVYTTDVADTNANSGQTQDHYRASTLPRQKLDLSDSKVQSRSYHQGQRFTLMYQISLLIYQVSHYSAKHTKLKCAYFCRKIIIIIATSLSFCFRCYMYIIYLIQSIYNINFRIYLLLYLCNLFIRFS